MNIQPLRKQGRLYFFTSGRKADPGMSYCAVSDVLALSPIGDSLND